MIITLCGLYNQEEVLNAAVEFTGPGVASLSMDARLSIANMTTEWGALVGWFPVDAVTMSYLEGRNRELRAQGITRISEQTDWRRFARILPRPMPMPCTPDASCLNLAEVTAARVGSRHGAGDAVGGRDREEEGRDPEGLPGFVRELAAGRPCGGGESARRQEGRGGSEVLSRRGQPFGAGRSREARHLADADGGWGATACLRDAALASDWARDCSKRAKSVSPPPIAISKGAWDRATRSAIWGARRSWRRRPSRATFAGRIQPSTARSRNTSSRLRRRQRRRRWRFCRASRRACAAGWSSCRKTI